jgi:hypothetical protein
MTIPLCDVDRFASIDNAVKAIKGRNYYLNLPMLIKEQPCIK